MASFLRWVCVRWLSRLPRSQFVCPCLCVTYRQSYLLACLCVTHIKYNVHTHRPIKLDTGSLVSHLTQTHAEKQWDTSLLRICNMRSKQCDQVRRFYRFIRADNLRKLACQSDQRVWIRCKSTSTVPKSCVRLSACIWAFVWKPCVTLLHG